MSQRGSHRTARRRAAVLAVAAALMGGTGCSAAGVADSPEERLRASLSQSVEAAQDRLWPFRDSLIADPEGTLPQLGFIADVRGGGDLADTFGGATVALLDLSSSPDDLALALATSSSVESGGGLFYDYRSAAVCFTLRFPTAEAAIHTEPSDCSGGADDGVTAATVDGHDLVSLDELTVRRTVSEADFAPPPCPCVSGGECDCPGG